MEVVLGPGDELFVPADTPHQVTPAPYVPRRRPRVLMSYDTRLRRFFVRFCGAFVRSVARLCALAALWGELLCALVALLWRFWCALVCSGALLWRLLCALAALRGALAALK